MTESQVAIKPIEASPLRKFNNRLYDRLTPLLPDERKIGLSQAIESIRNETAIGQAEGQTNRPFLHKVKGGLSRTLNEVEISSYLVSVITGTGLKTVGIKKTGDFLTDYPIKRRLLVDLENAVSGVEDGEAKRQITERVIGSYGIDKVDTKVFTHPDFLSRLGTSFLLNRTYYEGARQFFGWGAFASLIKLPMIDIKMPYSVDFFRQIVDQHGISTITAVSGGVLAGLMAARMGVDYWVLKNRDMTPDTLELFFALSGGKVDNDNRLRVNPKFGLIGAPIDVTVSSTVPPFSAAWLMDFPYSIPAYILAMSVDQITFICGNLAYAGISKLKKRK